MKNRQNANAMPWARHTDKVAEKVADGILIIQSCLASKAGQIVNRLPNRKRKWLFALIGLLVSAIFLTGLFDPANGLSRLAITSYEASHIGQPSGLTKSEQAKIKDSLTLKYKNHGNK